MFYVAFSYRYIRKIIIKMSVRELEADESIDTFISVIAYSGGKI